MDHPALEASQNVLLAAIDTCILDGAKEFRLLREGQRTINDIELEVVKNKFVNSSRQRIFRFW